VYAYAACHMQTSDSPPRLGGGEGVRARSGVHVSVQRGPSHWTSGVRVLDLSRISASRPHNHQNLHLMHPFSFSKTTRVDVRPKHAAHGRRVGCIILWSCDGRRIRDRGSLLLASSHGEQALSQKFLRKCVDLFPPPLRNRPPRSKRSRWFRVARRKGDRWLNRACLSRSML